MRNLALLMSSVLLLIGTATSLAAEPQMQKKILLSPEAAAKWSAAECTVESSNAPTRTGQPVLHWHVTVDHFTGEPNYPIGWPRINASFRNPAERDWSNWDFLQMWVYADTSRDKLPHDPAGLSLNTPDKDGAYHRPLAELSKGQWVQLRIPLTQVPRHDDVRSIQLHISESNYRHQDQVDFYIDDLALLRYAQPTLLEFAAEQAVMFADSQHVNVSFNLAGVKPEEPVEVMCELQRGGNVAARATVMAMRGPQRLKLNLGSGKLQPGEYQLTAHVAGGAPTPPATLQLVEPPIRQDNPPTP